MEIVTSSSHLPEIDEGLVAGIDVGGTKVHIADSTSSSIHRYNTPDHQSMDAVLEDYFQTMEARPAEIVVGMAGPRDDETGEIKLTNSQWPAFNPEIASAKYGINISTANDMVITTAGVLQESGVELERLKPGNPSDRGTKLVVALSTGIGSGAAVWDNYSKRYVILPGEGGHIGFQPKNEEEQKYLSYLNEKYPHASAELALSGKHGVNNLVDHSLELPDSSSLSEAIKKAREENRPVGAVLLAHATEGKGIDQQVAQKILGRLGAMVGSVLRDLTVAYKASGGVYLTGSVALGLGEYFAENTEMNRRFVRDGAVHDGWLEKTPIDLVTDPNVAVVGALALAKELKES